MDRLEAELDALGRDERDAHPWTAYATGATRYDLHADSGKGAASDYLRPGAEPTRWTLRRLGAANMARVQDMFTREINTEGASSLMSVWLECVRAGVVDVTGPDAPRLDHRHGKLTDASLDEIHDYCGGLAAISELGAAIWRLSQPLTDAEKKR